MSLICDICKKDVEELRQENNIWFCDSCFNKYYISKIRCEVIEKLSIICPFCNYKINLLTKSHEKCPKCGVIMNELYDGEYEFLSKNKEAN